MYNDVFRLNLFSKYSCDMLNRISNYFKEKCVENSIITNVRFNFEERPYPNVTVKLFNYTQRHKIKEYIIKDITMFIKLMKILSIENINIEHYKILKNILSTAEIQYQKNEQASLTNTKPTHQLCLQRISLNNKKYNQEDVDLILGKQPTDQILKTMLSFDIEVTQRINQYKFKYEQNHQRKCDNSTKLYYKQQNEFKEINSNFEERKIVIFDAINQLRYTE